MMDTTEKVSDILKEYRERSGLSLRGLALRVDRNPSQICRIEKGQQEPSRATLAAIVDALQIDEAGVNRIRRALI